MTGPAPRLSALLAKAARRARLTAVLTMAAWAALAMLLAFASFLLLDAAAALPPAGLRGAQAVLALTGLAGLVLVARRAWRKSQSPEQVAAAVERAHNLPPSTLANAVDLAAQTPAGASPDLCAEAVRRGEQAAQDLPAKAVHAASDTRGLLRAARALGIAALALLVLFALFPRLVKSGAARLMAPAAGLAAYTPLSFAVTVNPDPVVEGDPAAVACDITGTGLPEEAWLCFLEGETGTQVEERVAMPRQEAAAGKNAPGNAAARFAAYFDHPVRTRRFFVETARGRSEIHTLRVLALPRVLAVSATLKPPAYAGLPETKARVGPAGIRLLEGGVAEFTADCSMDLSGGRATFTADGKEPVDLPCQIDPADPRRLRVALDVAKEGDLAIVPTGAGGLAARAPFSVRVAAVADAEPSITLTEPEALIYVPEGAKVKVVAKATDDIAVARALALRTVNRWGPFMSPLAVKPSAQGPGQATVEWEFDLAALGAKAGDVIAYSAVAFDNRPASATPGDPRGPQRAVSAEQALRVIPMSEYLRHLREDRRMADLAAEAAQIQEDLETLKAGRDAALAAAKDAAQKMADGQPLTDADREALAKAAREAEAFAKAAREAADQLALRATEPAAYEGEKKFNQTMERLAKELAKQADLAEAAAKAADGQGRKDADPKDAEQDAGEKAAKEAAKAAQAAEAWKQFADHTAPFGDEALAEDRRDLEKLAATDELRGLKSELRTLALDQAALEKEMARFARKDGLTEEEKILSARFSAKEDELRQTLADLAQELADAADRMEKDLPAQSDKARELLKALAAEGVAQDMTDAATLAQGGEGRLAHAAAQSAAEKLLRLTKGGKKKGGKKSDPKGEPQEGQDNPDGQPSEGEGEGEEGEEEEDDGAEEDLENALDMEADALNRTLDQMGECRNPGSGRSSAAGTGKGSGKGAGKGSGRGTGKGAGKGGQSAGGQGQRVGGAKSKPSSLHGADRAKATDKAGSSTGRGQGAGRGAGGSGHDAASKPGERIEAGADAGRGAAGRALPGVPPAYRGLTEQYFRRVMEDGKHHEPGGQP